MGGVVGGPAKGEEIHMEGGHVKIPTTQQIRGIPGGETRPGVAYTHHLIRTL